MHARQTRIHPATFGGAPQHERGRGYAHHHHAEKEDGANPEQERHGHSCGRKLICTIWEHGGNTLLKLTHWAGGRAGGGTAAVIPHDQGLWFRHAATCSTCAIRLRPAGGLWQ
eukprot:SAG11_NODE_864_length_6839_cov_4.807567_2_plen_113_part_00